jgi:hypothetical protein
MARPPRPVDAALVERLGSLMCTEAEIAEMVGISVRTLQRRFGATLVRARAHARMSIRRAQYLRAVRDKSDKMLIWLGRCELGQGAADDGEGLDGILTRILAEHGRQQQG